MILVALEEFLAQRLEGFVQRRHVEGGGHHGAGTAGDHVADHRVRHRRQAALAAHGLAHGDEVRRRVQQGTVHVEQNSAQAHQASLRVWIM